MSVCVCVSMSICIYLLHYKHTQNKLCDSHYSSKRENRANTSFHRVPVRKFVYLRRGNPPRKNGDTRNFIHHKPLSQREHHLSFFSDSSLLPLISLFLFRLRCRVFCYFSPQNLVSHHVRFIFSQFSFFLSLSLYFSFHVYLRLPKHRKVNFWNFLFSLTALSSLLKCSRLSALLTLSFLILFLSFLPQCFGFVQGSLLIFLSEHMLFLSFSHTMPIFSIHIHIH